MPVPQGGRSDGTQEVRHRRALDRSLRDVSDDRHAEGRYEIYIAADACGDLSLEAHNRSMERAVQAGAIPITSCQYVFELQQDWARSNLRRRDGHPARAFALRHPGRFLEMGAGRTRLRRRSQGGRITIVVFATGRSAMKIYLLSAGAGILVGVIYSLLNVRSPAPPLVALVPARILIGEQVIPVGKATSFR